MRGVDAAFCGFPGLSFRSRLRATHRAPLVHGASGKRTVLSAIAGARESGTAITVFGVSHADAAAHRTPVDLRALWALEEMGLPYRIGSPDSAVVVADASLGISTIDDDGMTVSEPEAILRHLARKSGRLMPTDMAGREQVARWCFAALNTVSLPTAFLDILSVTERSGAPVRQVRQDLLDATHARLSTVARGLTEREFIASDQFTIADILMVQAFSGGDRHAELFEAHEPLKQYLARCRARPAWGAARAAVR